MTTTTPNLPAVTTEHPAAVLARLTARADQRDAELRAAFDAANEDGNYAPADEKAADLREQAHADLGEALAALRLALAPTETTDPLPPLHFDRDVEADTWAEWVDRLAGYNVLLLMRDGTTHQARVVRSEQDTDDTFGVEYVPVDAETWEPVEGEPVTFARADEVLSLTVQ